MISIHGLNEETIWYELFTFARTTLDVGTSGSPTSIT